MSETINVGDIEEGHAPTPPSSDENANDNNGVDVSSDAAEVEVASDDPYQLLPSAPAATGGGIEEIIDDGDLPPPLRVEETTMSYEGSGSAIVPTALASGANASGSGGIEESAAHGPPVPFASTLGSIVDTEASSKPPSSRASIIEHIIDDNVGPQPLHYDTNEDEVNGKVRANAAAATPRLLEEIDDESPQFVASLPNNNDQDEGGGSALDKKMAAYAQPASSVEYKAQAVQNPTSTTSNEDEIEVGQEGEEMIHTAPPVLQGVDLTEDQRDIDNSGEVKSISPNSQNDIENLSLSRRGGTSNELQEAVQPIQVDQSQVPISNTDNEESVQGDEECLVEAYIPEDAEVIIDGYAEPLEPWFRQKRTRLLLACIVVIIVAVAIGVPFMVTSNQESAPTAQGETILVTTLSPTMSSVPSSEPTTSHPTMLPTDMPSLSQIPTLSPTTSLWQQYAKEIQGDRENDMLGTSVSVSSNGKVMAVGAQSCRCVDDRAGYVSVYFREGRWLDWDETRVWKIQGETNGDRFGTSVSLASSNGKTVVAIGAPGNFDKGDRRGYVRVYSHDELSGWKLLSTLHGEAVGDQFGVYVSLTYDGTTLAVGANTNKGNGQSSGSVRVYRLSDDGFSWENLGQDIDGEAPVDNSGSSLSLASDGKGTTTVAIGALTNDGGGQNSGHVRVFQIKKGWLEWKQIGRDIDGDGPHANFGCSVSLSSDARTVAAEACGFQDTIGYTQVYRLKEGDGPDSTPRWMLLGQTIQSGEVAGFYSGGSVSLSGNGNVLAIGGPWDMQGGDLVRVYQIDEQSDDPMWKQYGNIVYGVTAFQGGGWSVSLSLDGNTLAVGAPMNYHNGHNSGEVRVYDAGQEEENVDEQDFNSTFTPAALLTSSISGFAFLDSDRDGIRDTANPLDSAIENIAIALLGCNDEIIMTTKTDGAGYYSFDELEEGEYYMQVDPSQWYKFSDVWIGRVDETGVPLHPNVESAVDPNTNTGRTSCFSLDIEEEKSLSFGMVLNLMQRRHLSEPDLIET